MCLPLAAGLAIASGVTSAAGALMQGQQAKAQANYNAAVARQNAQQEVDAYQTERGQWADERKQLWQRLGQVKGQQVAGMAANGIDPSFGSGARLQEDTIKLGYDDATRLYSNEQQKAKSYLIDASNYTSEAIAAKMQGSAAQTNSYFGAVSSLLGGATQAASLTKQAQFAG